MKQHNPQNAYYRVFLVIRRGLGLVLFCLWFSVWGLGSSTAHAQPFLSKEVSLVDWGLTHPSQIGYLSLGILHKTSGDEIIIYDIRKNKPVMKEPTGPQSQIPSFEGDVFLVSHFNRGNVNRLGGYFNGFARSPSKSSVAIERAPDGNKALTYSYANKTPGFAGFWIHFFDFKALPSKRLFLDATPFTYLTFSIRGENGGEQLQIRMADRTWEKREESLLIGETASFLPGGKVDKTWRQVWVPLSRLPEGLNQKELANVVFQVKGNGHGRIFIRDLAFTRKKDVSMPFAKRGKVPSRSLNKGMWLWETEKILKSAEEQKTLLAFCENHKITDLFIQIPYKAKKEKGRWKIFWNSSRMRPLIAQLHQAGIKAHALDGDPKYALKEWHGRVIALVEKIIQYNRKVSPKERFGGIRYDIEPYLLPSFRSKQRESKLKEYLELLEKSQALTKKSGLSFGVDIPFWFDGVNEFFEPTAAVEGRPVSERIIDIVDNVGIMDYRTVAYGADGVISHATDELRYAAKKGKKVFVGLETVTLPDETIYEFGPKGRGSSIMITTIDEQRVRLLWDPEGRKVAAKGIILLHQSKAVQVPSSKLTFQHKKWKDLKEVLQQTEEELRQFSSFHGFVIHSYESYRPWLEREKD